MLPIPPIDGNYPSNFQSNFYKVFIKSTRCGTTVEAYLPESFSESISSKWSGIMDGWQGRVDKLNTLLKATLNKSLQFDWMSKQIWEGNEPLSLSLELLFVSKINAKLDVTDKVNMLEKMASPSEEGVLAKLGNLTPPGPALLTIPGMAGKGDNIDIFIGGTGRVGGIFRVMNNVIITGVDVTWYNTANDTGNRHRAEVSLSIITQDVWTWNDIDSQVFPI